MSKLLLLVQSEADVQHLKGAAQAILNSTITGVWTVFSPAITVDVSEAAAKLDTEIVALRTAERAAADRGDYTAAAGYKTQREGKELDKAKALRDAWKTAPAEEKQAKIKAIFGPFGDTLKTKGLNVKITAHGDHYDREQWVAMLNSLSGAWFKEFTVGGFVVAWPEAVAGTIVIPEQSLRVKISPPVEIKPIELAGVPKTRREELEAMHHMSLRPIARKFGIEATGKVEMVEAILAAEATPAPEPALAEY